MIDEEDIKIIMKWRYTMDNIYNGENSLFPKDTPFAMCYVPFQTFDKTYEENVALERGTIFPELDFPFLGREVRDDDIRR